MLPQVNATLNTISPPGFSEDYDRAEGGEGWPVFEGPADAYYIEDVKTVYSQSEGALTKNRDVQLIIAADDLPDVTLIQTGYVVKFEYRGITHVRRVQDYVAKYMPGVPHNTIRLHLNPEPVEV